MDLHRNRPCACGSGKKLKRCCLDAFEAWRREGKGVVAAYVKLDAGGMCPVREWDGPLEADTPLLFEFNPITRAWIRNTFPDELQVEDPAYQALLLAHVATLMGENRLDASLAARLRHDRSARAADSLC